MIVSFAPRSAPCPTPPFTPGRVAPPAVIGLGLPHAGREADAGRLLDRILRSDGAARLLLDWCEERRIGEGPIRTVPGAGTGEAVPPDLLDHLDARAGEVVRHRRTVVTRGAIGLSDCDLWWLPGRLPPMLGEALDATDHPFGLVVAPLRPRRRTIFAELLPGGDRGGRHLVEHHAIVEVSGAGGTRPVAAVREQYRAALSRRG